MQTTPGASTTCSTTNAAGDNRGGARALLARGIDSHQEPALPTVTTRVNGRGSENIGGYLIPAVPTPPFDARKSTQLVQAAMLRHTDRKTACLGTGGCCEWLS